MVLGVIESVLGYMESHQPQSIMPLSLVVLVIFAIEVTTFISYRRLKRRVDELALIVKGLVNEREARHTREILGRSKKSSFSEHQQSVAAADSCRQRHLRPRHQQRGNVGQSAPEGGSPSFTF